jgi:poly(hydroxyalkanoate) depolymerase family esterase
VHVPDDLPAKASLVVVLHGCTQSAVAYDHGSGWSELADEQGFALLYPEQQRANNANRCFNWFEAGDTQRDAGEALSIRQMISAAVDRHGLDPKHVFVTGLSAGGAMTATLLATYPDVFAGGAIIAGLPHGVAHGMVQAFDRMRGHGLPAEADLQAALAKASDHDGPWPRLSIWHGGADTIVSPANADAIVAQWRGVHRVPARPTAVEQIGLVPHRSWSAADGRVLIEDYIVPGMAHGTPLRTKGDGSYGAAGPYMLEADLSSTARIAQFWGIAPIAQAKRVDPRPPPETIADLPARIEPRRLHGRRIEPEPTTRLRIDGGQSRRIRYFISPAARSASSITVPTDEAIRASGRCAYQSA